MSGQEITHEEGTNKPIEEVTNDTNANEGFSSEDIQKINNLNTNIDDLFDKIMKLTSQVEIDTNPELTLYSPVDITNISSSFQPYVPRYKDNQKEKQKDKQIKKQEVEKVTEKEQKEQKISMKHFQLGKEIGEGKFGIVYQCKHIPTGMIVALKKIYRSSIQQYNVGGEIENEVTILSEISHSNIMKLFGFFGDPYHFFIVTQYLPGKSLEKMLKSDVETVKDILYQLILALQYLHDLKIVHRDIKAENIIYCNGVVKLLDFGYATYLTEQPINQLCGTLDYASPEILEKQSYGLEVDVWALGVLAYELLTGTVPFPASSIEQKTKLFKQKQIQYPQNISSQAKSFLSSLLKINPKQRLKIYECLDHPFISNRASKQIELAQII